MAPGRRFLPCEETECHIRAGIISNKGIKEPFKGHLFNEMNHTSTPSAYVKETFSGSCL